MELPNLKSYPGCDSYIFGWSLWDNCTLAAVYDSKDPWFLRKNYIGNFIPGWPSLAGIEKGKINLRENLNKLAKQYLLDKYGIT